jgi:hypothetical protein
VCTCHLQRLPGDLVRSGGVPRRRRVISAILPLQELGSGARIAGVEAVFQRMHQRHVPQNMQTFDRRVAVAQDAVAAFVGIGRCMQRLVDVAHKMEQEREVAAGAPSIIASSAEPIRIFVDFGGYALSS